jgi:hypothetical protein
LKEETRDPHLTSSAGCMQSIFSGLVDEKGIQILPW